ncbi:Mbov_0121 family peptidase domain-containing ABC transporter [Mycoplasmopsis gallinacea]|uniref:ABC-type maltose/maltodextrin transporter ATP-binding protein MalK n=1 Tax=Mycoplasmopsis gallinacea TaxID=29556 RepID=A0A449A4A1_9BACT|nr:cysteine peptidase family C39 domain-containing protein [Mycoplasmopsis gallinacea]VEU59034.1 ABC-type maltose/maltodextrin transporter ATP-binding protein MalK [Mycoplasmopsis gallinacea]
MKAKQISSNECALIVLSFFIKKFTKQKISIEKLKDESNLSSKGLSLSELKELASSNNLEVNFFKCSADNLQKLESDEFPFATIIRENNFNHMVILHKIRKGKVYFYDPKKGDVKMKLEDFEIIYQNVVLEFKLNKDFQKIAPKQKAQKSKVKLSFLSTKISVFYFCVLMIDFLVTLGIAYANKLFFGILIEKSMLYLALSLFLILFWFILFNAYLKSFITKKLYQYSFNQFCLAKKESFLNLFTLNNKRFQKYDELEIYQRMQNYEFFIFYKLTFKSDVLADFLSFVISGVIFYLTNIYLISIVVIYCIFSLIICFFIKTNYDQNYRQIINNKLKEGNDFNNLSFSFKVNNDPILNETLLKKWLNQNNNSYKIVSNFYSNNINYGSIEGFLSIIAPIFILLIGAILTWHNKLSKTELIFFLTGASLFIKPVKNVTSHLQTYKKYKDCLEVLRIFEHNSKDIDEKNKSSLVFEQRIENIKISYLGYKFSSYKKLNIDNLIIDQKCIFEGNNGCGKTTLSKILSGVNDFDEGEILINNQIVRPFENNLVKQKIALIDSNEQKMSISLTQYLSVDNLNQFHSLLKETKLDILLSKVGIYDFETTMINELSKGQLQFVKLLKLFIFEYDVIIFDEAFENLSIEIFQIFQKYFQILLASKIVVEISHNQRYIFPSSKRITINGIK